MYRTTSHTSLGATLASVALLAGVIAWLLGWFVPDMPGAAPYAGAVVAPVAALPAPPPVTVTVLPGPD